MRRIDSSPASRILITLGEFRHGRHDPTCEISTDRFARAMWTPEGSGVVEVSVTNGASDDSRWNVRTHGDGAEWLERNAMALVGMDDTIPEIAPQHRAVVDAQRTYGWLRLGASHNPYHELLFAVLGQRITAVEAARQWGLLVRRYGSPAPDPHQRLRLPPHPDVLAEVPYHDLHTLGIERRRADALRAVARTAGRLPMPSLAGSARSSHEQNTVPDWRHQFTRTLETIPGVGPWTAAVAGGLAYGDPDALLVGDYHVKNTVAWALHGRARGTDEQMVDDLAVYAGQRHRIVRWLQLAGWRAPRRGPGRRNVQIARL